MDTSLCAPHPRMLPRNLECQAKAFDKLVTGIAKRLAPAQGDVWAKRDQAGEIYELLQQQLFTEVKVQTHLKCLLDEIGRACAGET